MSREKLFPIIGHSCEQCGSFEIVYDPKRMKYICDNCGESI